MKSITLQTLTTLTSLTLTLTLIPILSLTLSPTPPLASALQNPWRGGPNNPNNPGRNANERSYIPTVVVILNNVDVFRVPLSGGIGKINIMDNLPPQRFGRRRRTGRRGREDGGRGDGGGRNIFGFPSPWAGRSDEEDGDGGNDGDVNDNNDNDDTTARSSSSDGEGTIRSDNAADQNQNSSQRTQYYPLTSAVITNGPTEAQCFITATPDRDPWLIGVFDVDNPLRVAPSPPPPPSSPFSSSSSSSPPPSIPQLALLRSAQASEIWCYYPNDKTMRILLSIDNVGDGVDDVVNLEVNSNELNNEVDNEANNEVIDETSSEAIPPQTPQLVAAAIYDRVFVQGPIQRVPEDSPALPTVRAAAVVDARADLTCRIIFYNDEDGGRIYQSEGFAVGRELKTAGMMGVGGGTGTGTGMGTGVEMGMGGIRGARSVYCDNVPLGEYRGNVPYQPTI